MSTRWGYICETCNDESPHWWNHADDELNALYVLWPVIKPVYDILKKDATWHLSLTFSDLVDYPDPFDFLHIHDGHTIALHSEYNTTKALT